MFVRAIKQGFYSGRLMQVGDEFALDDPLDAGAWMLPIDVPTKPLPKPDGHKDELKRALADADDLRGRVVALEFDLSSARRI